MQLKRVKISHSRHFVTVCILLSLCLSSCTSPEIYHDRSFNPPVYFGTHVVREGETLYAIAWRYGRDFRELAADNGISSPYVITPGQKISLERTRAASGSVSGATGVGDSGRVNVTKRKSSNKSSKNVTKIKKLKDVKDIKWQWPHLGPILAKYRISANANSQSDINKGIDIGGVEGDPVYAAASGEVVYAGSGLLGYGNLVIINHSTRYLSAYAHNRRILVQEGQTITAGQRIAELGRSGTDKPKLHFEIRKDGKPVNPLQYLPAR